MIAGGGGTLARKNPVDCFLPGCRDHCIAEHCTGAILGGDQAYIGVHWRRMLMPTKHPAAPQVAGTPSPKLESIGRPRRPPPLYILMSSISSHWTIQPPLTLCTFISDPIWPPQEVQCIMKTVKLNLEHCILHTHPLGPAVRLEQDLQGFVCTLAPCLLSCLLLSLQINVLLS